MEITNTGPEIKNYQTYNCLPEFQVDPEIKYDCSPIIKSKGFTPFMRMVQYANRTDILEIIATHIKKQPLDINYQNEKGWTALWLLVEQSYNFI